MHDNDDNEADAQLFRAAMQGVKPLKTDTLSRRPSKKKPVRIRQSGIEARLPERFSDARLLSECPTILDFNRSGVQPNTLKKLRQGRLAIESELDLHGMTVEQARTALLQFLDECRRFEYRCVCIVHGKGFSSPGNQPVIKPLLNRWLREAPEVLAFHSAVPKHGGSGSLYVLLRRQREPSDEL